MVWKCSNWIEWFDKMFLHLKKKKHEQFFCSPLLCFRVEKKRKLVTEFVVQGLLTNLYHRLHPISCQYSLINYLAIFTVFINKKMTKKKTLFVIFVATERIGNKIWQSTTRFTTKRNVLSVITLPCLRITLNFISIKDIKKRTVVI